MCLIRRNLKLPALSQLKFAFIMILFNIEEESIATVTIKKLRSNKSCTIEYLALNIISPPFSNSYPVASVSRNQYTLSHLDLSII